jgi:6,7-dimethyl-8-ribityllumazine synthase
VIRGETDHYEHIAHAAASGLAAVARESGIPVGFGVLTVGEESQARARSKPGAANKGAEAARAAVATARLLDWLRGPADRAPRRRGAASTRAGRRPRPRKAG